MPNKDSVWKVLEEILEGCDEPCRADHHGYCQSHFLHLIENCPVARAKQLLEEHNK